MRFIKLVLTCVLLMPLMACVSSPMQPVTVVVNNDGIHVLGTSVKMVDDLAKLLAEKNISRIVIRAEPDNDYEAIGKVIYGMSRNKVKIEAINGMALK